jgi:hypothetical protein
MKTLRDADKSAEADLGWQQEDRLRAKGAKIILKCDTQKNSPRVVFVGGIGVFGIRKTRHAREGVFA